MSDKAAFRATYSDLRLVKGRKVLQLVFEVPLEESNGVLAALGGMPNPAAEVWCAIARLNPETERTVTPNSLETERSNRPDNTPPASGPDIQARARNRYAQRAGILCSDPLFQKYLELNGRWKPVSGPIDNNMAAAIIRDYCGVDSRAEIIVGTEAATRFDLIESAFVCWRDAPELTDAS